MSGNADLHALIHSLEPNEKRRFRQLFGKNQSTEGSAVYLKLFDDLNKWKGEYDEDAFRKKFHSSPHNTSNFSYNKTHLTEMILDSLRFRSREKSKFLEIAECAEDAVLLKRRLFHNHSKKELKKAIKKARETENYEMLVMLLRQENAMLMEQLGAGFEKEIKKNESEIEKVTGWLTDTNQLSRLKNEMLLVQRLSHSKKKETIARVAGVKHGLAAFEFEKLHSFDAKVYFRFCHYIIHILEGDLDAAWEGQRKILHLYDNSEFAKTERLVSWKNAQYNFMNLSNAINKYHDFIGRMYDYEKTGSTSPKVRMDIRRGALMLKLQYYINDCDWEGGKDIIQAWENEKEVLENGMPAGRIALIYITICWFYFITREYKKASLLLQQLLGLSSNDMSGDILSFSELYTMIIGIERNQDDDLAAAIRNAGRRLKRKEVPGEFENVLKKFIAAWAKVPVKEQKKLLEKLISDLTRLRKSDAQLGMSLPARIVLLWADSKLKGISLKQKLEEEKFLREKA